MNSAPKAPITTSVWPANKRPSHRRMTASMIYALLFGLLSIGYGIWAMRRPKKIAEQNREFIESGKETYFEQRRSWEAYGSTPSTDSGEIYRRGRKEIILGIMLVTVAALFYFLD